MSPIYIPHLLSAANRTRTIFFETGFDGLNTLMPIRAEVAVRHGSTFLDIRGTAQTIVTLSCDRCLQNYNHRLSVDAKEIIWLHEPSEFNEAEPLEQEVGVEDLVESLSPYGHFDAEKWIYEQVCLALPQRQICDASCQGLIAETQADRSPEDAIDHRWSALAALKQQMTTDEYPQN